MHRGGFEWTLPRSDEACAALGDLLGIVDPAKSPKIRRALDSIAAITFRAGLQHPRFDPGALEHLPFRRSTTIIADTSGAVQGGLDFVANYLHPAARVKVPAIVQMEIVNFAERFLSNMRAARTRAPDLLLDHMISQGGQRVLLRLELHADIEIERNFLLGDPLRNAFQVDTEQEIRDLNLAVILRSYADRLIVESARQHQAQSNLGHPVQLLTSDQGLARMAIGEGLTPLFFNSIVGEDALGKRLSGQVFSPFAGVTVGRPLAAIVWEVASAFGAARLRSEDAEHELTVTAIGEALSWSPYQSQADLLWCDFSKVPAWNGMTGSQAQPEAADTKHEATAEPAKKGSSRKLAKAEKRADVRASVGVGSPPRFNVERFLDLVDALDNEQTLTPEKVLSLAQVRSRESLKEYNRFLSSAGLITSEGGTWSSTDQTRVLAVALRGQDIDDVRRSLAQAPSFELLVRTLAEVGVGSPTRLEVFGRAAVTYRTLGEVCRMCAPVAGEGLYSTPSTPNAEAFAPLAIKRFGELANGEQLVATGAWLETLIRKDGVHPEVARDRLSEASARHFLTRSTEGSTTEVRFDDHVIQVLRSKSGRPILEDVHLYRGDYLIPGKSSSSLFIGAPES